ncbi:Uracil-DNA glycosylase, family 4 [hydrothermal vent metagenome]|uniref:Type-4 uracil-DNA glycosylase n=1 Tax=hydrothermal vent metagenome TaxID=652676 RepID=A0A3B1BRZ4_9ZZZZ
MNNKGQILAKLSSLRLELETLRLYGKNEIEGIIPDDIIKRLNSAPVMEKEKTTKEETLDDVMAEVSACKKCELSGTRINTVFGVGNPNADLMFIGEAPGAEEDKRAEPFVGRAGKLLTKMIEAMGLTRNDIYIANILKCRPPENRNPLPAEVELCEHYLTRQIDAIRPKFICALGAVSAKTLLKTKEPISKLRGSFYSYHGTPLLPTFHPAYLLRNPAEKKNAWADLKLLMEKLGLPEKTGSE